MSIRTRLVKKNKPTVHLSVGYTEATHQQNSYVDIHANMYDRRYIDIYDNEHIYDIYVHTL